VFDPVLLFSVAFSGVSNFGGSKLQLKAKYC
jgi:hypothetical protein